MAEFLDHKTIGLARICAEDSQAAGIRENCYAAPARQWLIAKCRRQIKHFVQRVSANNTRLVKQSFHRNIAGRQCCGVRSGSAAPGRRSAGFHGDDRFVAADPPGDPGKTARVAEGLETKKNYLRLFILFPVLQKVISGDIGFVADTDKVRNSQFALAGERKYSQTQ